MADFAKPMPIEPEKSGNYLHERSHIPASPLGSLKDWPRQNAILIVEVLLAFGFVALGFQTRASWGAHRDWVVPVTVPFLAAGGVSLGHLIGRREWSALAYGGLSLSLALLVTGLTILRGRYVDGEDNGQDAMTIITAVLLGFSILSLVVATIWVELKRPTKAKPPEM